MVRVLRASAALALSAAGLLLGPPARGDDGTGLAPSSSAQCATGQLCVWASAGYVGRFAAVSSTTIKSTGMSLAGAVRNRSSKAAAVYSGASGSGTATCFAPGAQISSTSVAAASFRLLTTSTC